MSPSHARDAPQDVPRCVVLRHDLPDGSWHLDWMLQRPGSPPDALLLTFRAWPGPHDAASVQACAGRLELTRLPDHRAVYLEKEGPLSGNRGTVRRLARGRVVLLRDTGPLLLVGVQWDGPVCVWECRQVQGEHWQGRLLTAQEARTANL